MALVQGGARVKWSQWKIGCVVAVLTGLGQAVVAAASAEAFSFRSVVVPIMFNVGTNLMLYLKQHPVEAIVTDTSFITLKTQLTTVPSPPAETDQKT